MSSSFRRASERALRRVVLEFWVWSSRRDSSFRRFGPAPTSSATAPSPNSRSRNTRSRGQLARPKTSTVRENRAALNVVRSRFVVAFVVSSGCLRRRPRLHARDVRLSSSRRGRTPNERPPRFFRAGNLNPENPEPSASRNPVAYPKTRETSADVPRNGDRSASATRDSRLDFGTRQTSRLALRHRVTVFTDCATRGWNGGFPERAAGRAHRSRA